MSNQQIIYNPYKTPCCWDMARDHAKAFRPGKQIKSQIHQIQSDIKAIKTCPCCFFPIEKQSLPICSSLNQLAQFGYAYPLFYHFLFFCVVSLLVLMANSSLIILHDVLTSQNSLISDAENNGKHLASFIVQLSSVKLNINNSKFQVISVVSFISQLLILIYTRWYIRKEMKCIYQPEIQNQSLYSLMFYNFPEGNDNNQQKIANFLEKYDNNCQINSVLPIMSMRQFYHSQQQVKHCISDWKRILKSKNKTTDQIFQVFKTLKSKQQQLQKKKQLIRINERKYFNGIAIVTFQNIKDKHKFEKIQTIDSMNLLEEFFDNVHHDRRIRIQSVGHPNEIIWENIAYTRDQRSSSQGFGNFLVVIVLAGFFLGYFLLQDLFHSLKQEGQSPFFKKFYPSIVSMSLVFLMNKFILIPVVHKICDREHHRSYTDQLISFSQKLVIGYFTTTALMVIFVQGIIHENFIDNFGIIQQQSIFFVINCVMTLLISIINPDYILSRIKAWVFKDRKSFSQEQANNLMKYPQYNLAKRYADVIKIIWFTFMYGNIIPIGNLFSVTCLILYYWIDKYNLLRKSSLMPYISNELSDQMINLLDLVLVIKPLTNLYMVYAITQEISYIDIILASIGGIYISLPLNAIIKRGFCYDNVNIPITKVVHKFTTLYEFQYPLTAELQKKHQFYEQLTNKKIYFPSYDQQEEEAKTQKVQIQRLSEVKQQKQECKLDFKDDAFLVDQDLN